MTKRLLVVLGCLTFPLSRFPFPGLSAQQRAMTIEDYLALPSVGDPQLSPDGKWVAYTVTHYSLKENGRTLAFVSTRESGPQLWLLSMGGAGGEARRVSSLADGVSDPVWLPDGTG